MSLGSPLLRASWLDDIIIKAGVRGRKVRQESQKVRRT
jgi:hypothetical protein